MKRGEGEGAKILTYYYVDDCTFISLFIYECLYRVAITKIRNLYIYTYVQTFGPVIIST